MNTENEIKVFQKNGEELRTVLINGEPWFVVPDLCRALGHSNPSMAMKSLLPEEKGLSKVYTPGGDQELTVCSESGLYTLILRSNKPEAVEFRRWVTMEVLPSVRKTGLYGIPQSLPDALRLAADLADKNMKLQENIKINQPKIDFFDAVTNSRAAIDMKNTAKVLNLGLGRNSLFALLRKEKILMADNLPYQEFVDRRYFRVIETKYVTADGEIRICLKTLVYQKGLDFIRRLVISQREIKGAVICH